ncbi:forkhead box protein O6 [Carettochelys insculpta]|uniref:forkhead box protein O6 n=1 Tax=Carettochelys insculpta TaxID=44489 RepID=UPI003EB7F121
MQPPGPAAARHARLAEPRGAGAAPRPPLPRQPAAGSPPAELSRFAAAAAGCHGAGASCLLGAGARLRTAAHPRPAARPAPAPAPAPARGLAASPGPCLCRSAPSRRSLSAAVRGLAGTPRGRRGGGTMAEKRQAQQVDIDPDFEPQSRPRSCTWPLPHPDFPGEEEDGGAAAAGGAAEGSENTGAVAERKAASALPSLGADVGQLRKAKNSRRNAWGNLSYADLITKAIESSPEKRLTLSQIYDWMVRYVPYFKDKGDSNSSAGWKNSIRHNLSLHTRFIRVQNEGTGKSSWWMLNPEGGKAGKPPRRRSVSMDNASKFLRIKGKASRKKQLQAAQERGEDSPSAPQAKWSESPASHASDEYDAWAEFRPRANPPGSGLGGRLSPILASHEPDELEEDEGGTPSSPLMYPSPSSTVSPSLGSRCSVELPRLADLTGTISLGESLLEELQDSYGMSSAQPLPAGGLRHRSSSFPCNAKCSTLGAGAGTYCGAIYSQPAMSLLRRLPMQTIQENKQASFAPAAPCRPASLQDLLSSTSYVHKEGLAPAELAQAQAGALAPARGHRQSVLLGAGGELGLSTYPVHSAALLKSSTLYHPAPASHHPAVSTSALPPPISLMSVPSDSCSLAAMPHHGHLHPYGHPPGAHHSLLDSLQGPYQGAMHPPGLGQDRFPADLDLDMFNGSLECDVESIILNDFMDSDEMDFNFDSALPPQNGLSMATLPGAPQPPNQSWVPG